MAEKQVTGNDIAQAISQSLVAISAGREVKKSKVQLQIEMLKALDGHMQTHINGVKVMCACKAQGIDFAASMSSMRTLFRETGEDVASMAAAAGGSE